MSDMGILIGSTEREKELRDNFLNLFRTCSIPDLEVLSNLGLFINRQTLSRILFICEIYKKIIDVHGVVMEFCVRWGQNLALFSSLRGIYEPFNYNRKIIGFDTFSGFPQIDEKDGRAIKKGDYSVTEEYEKYLSAILEYHESESPIPHKKKFEFVKGDVAVTIDEYLSKHPETIVALAYFDLDLYSPTKKMH